MKKTLALILALALLALCLAGCAGKPAETAPTQAPASAAPATAAPAPADTAPTDAPAPEDTPAPSAEGRTFTVGFDAEFPPFGFIADDGSYDGFDLAAAAEICARKGWTFVAQPINWDFKDAELSSGSIDCIWNGFTIEGREDAYTWSPAYYDSSVVVVVRADSGIASLADLAGKSVITQAASSGLSALEGNPELTATFAELLESADYNNAFMELGMGTVDAVVADVGVAEYNMQNKSGDFLILDEPVSVETYGIGFLKGNEELMLEVWDEYISLAADGTLAALADKYVPYGLVKENVIHIVPAPKADAVEWRTFTVGFDAEFPPFGFIADNGSYDGFDLAVADMEVGETKQIHLMPSEAYGERREEYVFTVEMAQMPGTEELEVGEHVYLQNMYGQPVPVTVAAKDETTITFDANHEMAGKELNFTIELVEVKEQR